MRKLTLGQAEDVIMSYFDSNIPDGFNQGEIYYPNEERNDVDKYIELSTGYGRWQRYGASRTSLKRCDFILNVVINLPKNTGNQLMIDTIDHIEKVFDNTEFHSLGFTLQGIQVDDGMDPEKYSKQINIVTYIEGS